MLERPRRRTRAVDSTRSCSGVLSGRATLTIRDRCSRHQKRKRAMPQAMQPCVCSPRTPLCNPQPEMQRDGIGHGGREEEGFGKFHTARMLRNLVRLEPITGKTVTNNRVHMNVAASACADTASGRTCWFHVAVRLSPLARRATHETRREGIGGVVGVPYAWRPAIGYDTFELS